MGFFDRFFGQGRAARDQDVAVSGDAVQREKLAASRRTRPELLYYLAQNDPDAAVRKAVAANRATPVHAGGVLAADSDPDVRLALANRLLRLLPDLTPEHHQVAYTHAVEALAALALDEVLKIRVALSSSLKDHAYAPPKIVGQLARDIEREVSEPILRFCMALSDDDLLDIIRNHASGWARVAIAGRAKLPDSLATALITYGDEDSGMALLNNGKIMLSPGNLSAIVEQSKNFPQLQKPIAIRKNLSGELAVRLMSFVDETVRRLLLDRTDFDAETRGEIQAAVQRRLDMLDAQDMDAGEAVRQKVINLTLDNRLNEEAIVDALAISERGVAVAVLAALARISAEDCEKIIALQKAKPLIALCWRAGVSMRLCLKLQRELLRLPADEQILPKGGTDYPLERAEIDWQLEYLGLT